MKGIIDIEFIFSVMIFLTTITFVTFIIISNIPLFHREAVNEDLRARAYEISELLLVDKGYPENWDAPNIAAERLGLSGGGRYNLSSDKITELKSMCQTSYENVKTLLGHDYRNDVTIEIIDSGNNHLLECLPPVITTVRPKFQITRFAVLKDKRIVRMVVGVS